MKARLGAVSLVELLLVMALSVPVFATWAAFARTQSRAAAAQQGAVRMHESLRAARIILQNEVRYALPVQWVAAGGDSLSFRAVRGGGAVCSVTGDELTVRYSGVRFPDPSKDSVLLISDSVVELAAIAGSAPVAVCDGGLRIELSAPPSLTPAFTLIFERGTYAIAGGALRYRRGAAGRQPLTEDILAPGSGMSPSSRAIELTLRPENVWGSDERIARIPLTRLNADPGFR